MYIYINLYTHILQIYIYVAVYASNARGSIQNTWRLYAKIWSPKPESVPHRHRECSRAQVVLFSFMKSVFPKRIIHPVLLSTQRHSFSCFNLHNSTSGFSLFWSSKCYWILKHALLMDIFVLLSS